MSHTRHVLGIVLALALLLISLAGCQPAEAKEVSLTEVDNGASVTLEKGQVLAITLPARPTKGERWDPDDLAVYKDLPMGREQFRPDSNLAGFDGHQILRFEAKTRGTWTVRLLYQVVGGDGTAISTFEVTVTVE